MDKNTSILGDELNFEIVFPFTLTKTVVDVFLKSNKDKNERYLSMYN